MLVAVCGSARVAARCAFAAAAERQRYGPNRQTFSPVVARARARSVAAPRPLVGCPPVAAPFAAGPLAAIAHAAPALFNDVSRRVMRG